MNGTEVHAYRVFDKALSRTTWVVPFPKMRVQTAPAQFRFHETMMAFALGSLVYTSKESKDLNVREIVVKDTKWNINPAQIMGVPPDEQVLMTFIRSGTMSGTRGFGTGQSQDTWKKGSKRSTYPDGLGPSTL